MLPRKSPCNVARMGSQATGTEGPTLSLSRRKTASDCGLASLIVNDEPARQRILTALADEYSRQILTATADQPQSALQLSKDFNIPITTLYRRIRNLADAGLITSVQSSRTVDGKWYELYQSSLLRIDVSFEYGEIRVNAKLNDHISGKFTRMWTNILAI